MSVYLTHFAEDDIEVRSSLQRDHLFQTNIDDAASTSQDDELAARQQRTIDEEHETKRIFTVRRGKGEIIGFCWITSIDWRSQCCEVSLALLPRFRHAMGALLSDAVFRYLYDELNFKVLVNQVMAHNSMLLSEDRIAELHQVRRPYDQFTAGRWNTACYWTVTREQSRMEQRGLARRRADNAVRVNATLGKGQA